MHSTLTLNEFYGVSRRPAITPAFAFAEVEDFDCVQVPKHEHENAHFLFVLKGEYEAVVKDKKLRCSPSTMLYYPAGTVHADHFYSPGERRFLTVSLIADTSRKLLEDINFVDYSIDFSDGEISWLGKRIRKELHSPDSLSLIVLEAMAYELLIHAARNLDKSDKPPAWLKTAYELLKDRCSDDVTVAEIAQTVGVHPLHLARTFRKFFQCSPVEYLRKCRIESASNLLLNSKKTLIEIALTSGFSDQSHFTQTFKQLTGVTPAKFRKLHNS